MSHSLPAKEWLPARFTIGHDGGPDNENPFLVVISNQPLEEKKTLLGLCYAAILVACADGGANRLHDIALDADEERMIGLSVICGDMDSARPEVLDYYEERGVRVVKDADQYTTDLMKCLTYIGDSEELAAARQSHLWPAARTCDQWIDVAILGGLGGRADQAFSQLHHLFVGALRESYPWVRDVYLIAKDSVIFLLKKGLNRIYAPVKRLMFTENVGIIPLGKPSVITTRGLEWDVLDWPTEFGGQMSTSNHIKAEVIEVETTERVLFTLEYDLPFGDNRN